MTITVNPDVIDHLVTNNDEAYNIDKCLEEMAELSEKLLKYKTKKPEYRPSHDEINEEIGDVHVRMSVITQIFSSNSKVQERVNKKTDTLSKSIIAGRYKGGT